jgi:hypothetical protein
MSDISDYESNEDYDNESVTSEIDYNTDDDENIRQLVSNTEESKTNFLFILAEKAYLIVKYNNGEINEGEFSYKILELNHELARNEYMSNLKEEIIDIKSVLDDYSSKLLVEKLTFDEYRNLVQIIHILKIAREPPESKKLEILPTSILWERISQEEQDEIKEIAKKSKKNPIYYPERADFQNEQQFQNAQDVFFNKIALFIPGSKTRYNENLNQNVKESAILSFYEEEEKKEMDTLAKNLNIQKPKKYNSNETVYNQALNIFYNNMSQLLPGYVHKMTPTSIGYTFEKVDPVNIKNLIKEQYKELGELRIKVSTGEIVSMLKKRYLKKLLTEVAQTHGKEFILNCLLNNLNLPKPEEAARKGQTAVINTDWEISSSWMKDIYFSQKEKKRAVEGRQRKPINYMPRELARTPNYNISEVDRRNARVKIGKYINPKKIEDYIFKTSPNLNSYVEKVDDVIFIFKNYPNIKEKLNSGKINIYQIVLFEKEISEQIELNSPFVRKRKNVDLLLHSFPTTVQNRKRTLTQINHEIKKKFNKGSQKIFKKRINDKSSEFEKTVFEISKNEQEYKLNAKKLLNFIKLNRFVLFTRPVDAILYDKPTDMIIDSPDYTVVSLRELDTIIESQNEQLKQLNLLYNKQKALNYDGMYIYLWKPPADVVQPFEINKWNELLKEGNQNKLSDYKQYLVKKYPLKQLSSVTDILKNITKTETLIKQLENIRGIKLNDVMKKWETGYIEVLKEIYNPKQQTITTDFINQIVDSYKRKLIGKSNFKLINLLELYDTNETNIKLNNKLVSLDTYKKVKEYLLKELNKVVSGEPSVILQQAKLESVNQIGRILGITDITSVTDGINKITQRWKITDQYYLPDPYDVNIFSNTNPYFFYNNISKQYDQIVKHFLPKKEEVYRRARVLFNEVTGKFGDPNGVMYNVEYLDRNPSTRLPVLLYKEIMKKNLRTGNFEVETVTVEQKGKYPFIKRYLPTVSGELKSLWTPVEPISAIKYYTNDYDSCERFKVQKECVNGKGLGYKPCVFNNGVCKSSFGKSSVKIELKKNESGIKYKLSDNVKTRHAQIDKRIRFEKKIKGNLHDAAVAFKKRLVVLRTYNKHKPSKYKILNSDINYINKKYKI